MKYKSFKLEDDVTYSLSLSFNFYKLYFEYVLRFTTTDCVTFMMYKEDISEDCSTSSDVILHKRHFI